MFNFLENNMKKIQFKLLILGSLALFMSGSSCDNGDAVKSYTLTDDELTQINLDDGEAVAVCKDVEKVSKKAQVKFKDNAASENRFFSKEFLEIVYAENKKAFGFKPELKLDEKFIFAGEYEGNPERFQKQCIIIKLTPVRDKDGPVN